VLGIETDTGNADGKVTQKLPYGKLWCMSLPLPHVGGGNVSTVFVCLSVCQHLITYFLQAVLLFLTPSQQCQSTEGNVC